ncbi:MAG: hypothetical protein PSV36_01630, partial [Algoriphagus sp.]|nr:hypothetical protein [Algoriphagus sp.]
SGGSCGTTTATKTITVNPTPTLSSPLTLIACSNVLSTYTATSTIPGTTFSWTRAAVAGISNSAGSGSGADASETLINTTANPIDVVYSYTLLASGCSNTQNVTVTVNPITAITTQPSTADDVECFGDGFDELTVVAEGADLTYQWYSVPTQVNTGGTAIPGATLSSFTPPSINLGISYYYVVVSGYCSSDTSVVSGEYEVTPPQTTIVKHPSTVGETLCQGETFSTLTVEVNGEITLIGDFEYQWYSNTSPSNTGGTLLTGETDPDFTPPSTNVGTLYYYATGRSDCGTVPTAISGAFTVTPLTEITAEDLDEQIICDGDTFDPISVTAIGSGTINYQWYSNTTNSTSGPNVTMVGTDSNTFSPPASPVGALYYFVVVSSTCGPNETSSVSGVFRVHPLPSVTNASLTQTVCSGGSTAQVDLTSAVAGTTFAWTATATTGVTGFTAIGSGPIPTQTISTTATTRGTVTYVVTPSANGCPGPTTNYTVLVDPLPTVTNASLTQSVCSGGSTTQVDFTSAVASTTFDWTASATTGVTGFTASGTGSIPVETLTTTSTIQGTVTYVITPTADGCPGPTTNYTVLVNPIPTVTNTSLTQTICSGGSTTLVPLTSDVSGTTFAWTVTASSGVTGFTAIGSGPIPVQTISTSGTARGTVTYVITPTANGCPGPTTSYTVLVDPQPTVTNTPLTQTICTGGSTTQVNLTSAIAGTTFAWTATATPGVTGFTASGTGTIPTQTIATTGTTQGTVTYVITPTANGCPGPTTNYTVLVSPIPEYELISVSSVSATSAGGSATITIIGDPSILTDGNYIVTYDLDDGTSITTHTSSSFSVSGGRGSFTTIQLTNLNVELFTVTIKSIKKGTDACTVILAANPKNSTVFSVCGASFDSSGTFYVPANIYEITIQVWGGGGQGGDGDYSSGGGGGGFSTHTISVTPGEPIGIFVGAGGGKAGTTGGKGGTTYVTRDSSDPNFLGASLVYAEGGNKGVGVNNPGSGGINDPRRGGGFQGIIGEVGLSTGPSQSRYAGAGGTGANGGGAGAPRNFANSNGQEGSAGGGGGSGGNGNSRTGGLGGNGRVLISYSCPDADKFDCIEILDDGAASGTTLIRFTCDDTWDVPEGLVEFSVVAVGAGGGGGYGQAAGGGGAGGFSSSTFTSNNPYGMPSTALTITVGQGGLGSSTNQSPGGDGGGSYVTGEIPDPNGEIDVNLGTEGGGGGGSFSSIPANLNGRPGGSGGGGGANIEDDVSGTGGAGSPGYKGGEGKTRAGLGGGDKGAAAGGGGGGAVPTDPKDIDGTPTGAGLGKGGTGGNGLSYTLGGTAYYYGGGGGGVGYNFEGQPLKPGDGGLSPIDIMLGGIGSDTRGGDGTQFTGSGGGAGRTSGGNGGSGVVYISFFNYRILPIEYLYFNATYNKNERSGELKWATAKEWENSHFEIERSVNDTRNWTKVGEVTGKGYSDVPVEYSFTDLNLPASGGNIFYRLKQVNLSGDFNYSVTRSIQVEAVDGSTAWIAYPNPSAMGSTINVDLLDRSGFTDGTIQIRISDARGIYENYSVSSPDEVSSVVNSYLDQARPGLHILHLIWGNKSEQLKLIRN